MASAIKSTATDRSLKELLDGLLLSQRQDIHAYSGGHLNESNLWKPPERATYSSWKSAKKDLAQTTSSYFRQVSSVINLRSPKVIMFDRFGLSWSRPRFGDMPTKPKAQGLG